MVHLAREEGAKHIRFLLVFKATETYPLPKTFKDVAKLLADSKKRWLESCLKKLKLLKDRDVYEIMDLSKGSITNFIWPYLHQFFDDSHSLKSYRKPSKRPFNQCQSHLEAINIGRDIKQIN